MARGLPAWGLTLFTPPSALGLGCQGARVGAQMHPEDTRAPQGMVPGSFFWPRVHCFSGKLFSANWDWWSDNRSAPWFCFPPANIGVGIWFWGGEPLLSPAGRLSPSLVPSPTPITGVHSERGT